MKLANLVVVVYYENKICLWLSIIIPLKNGMTMIGQFHNDVITLVSNQAV